MFFKLKFHRTFPSRCIFNENPFNCPPPPNLPLENLNTWALARFKISYKLITARVVEESNPPLSSRRRGCSSRVINISRLLTRGTKWRPSPCAITSRSDFKGKKREFNNSPRAVAGNCGFQRFLCVLPFRRGCPSRSVGTEPVTTATGPCWKRWSTYGWDVRGELWVISPNGLISWIGRLVWRPL